MREGAGVRWRESEGGMDGAGEEGGVRQREGWRERETGWRERKVKQSEGGKEMSGREMGETVRG